jgi:hypothetical protein
MKTVSGDSMKVYVIRKYLKRTRWDCNHSTKFEEIEFQTKEEALAYRSNQRVGVFDVYEKEV